MRPPTTPVRRAVVPLTVTTATGKRVAARPVAERASTGHALLLPLAVPAALLWLAVAGQPPAAPHAPTGGTPLASAPAPAALAHPGPAAAPVPPLPAPMWPLPPRIERRAALPSATRQPDVEPPLMPRRLPGDDRPIVVPLPPLAALRPPEEPPLAHPPTGPARPPRDAVPHDGVPGLVGQCPGSPERLARGRAGQATQPHAGRPDPRGFGLALAAAARAQLGELVVYSPRYVSIAYPMGDVAPLYGVCTDVVVRAYRALGIDLQELVQTTRSGRGDRSIDHRRVDVLRGFLARHGTSLPPTDVAEDYKPGDIVTYYRPQNRTSTQHIAIVTDVIAPSGRPMIVHNRGWGPQLEDALFVDRMTGHYRFAGLKPGAPPAAAPALVAARPAPAAPAQTQRRTVLMQSSMPGRVPSLPPVSR